MNYYEIAPISPKIKLHDVATYQHDEVLEPGTVVAMSYRRSHLAGVILNQTKKPKFATKPLNKVTPAVNIPSDLIALARWMSGYYALALPQAMQAILPAGIEIKRRNKTTTPANTKNDSRQASPKLSTHQSQIVNNVVSSRQVSHLLHGITGSGKTHIYIELIARSLREGRDAILLVPEIALSAHLLERILPFFPRQQVYMLHSQQSQSERHLTWQRIRNSKEPVLVVGPRSAVFSPVKQLGVIIADEAHDSSFKQQQTPHYDALLVAAQRAHHHEAKLVMGTATPDVVNFYLSEKGKIELHTLEKKFHPQTKHQIELIDRRDKSVFGEDSAHLSTPLVQAIHAAANSQKQSLIFINRRGFATSIICSECSWIMECERCQLPLTYHKADHKAHCHICGKKYNPPLTCPECNQPEIRFRGSGTQRIEEEIEKLFRKQQVVRVDRDTRSNSSAELMNADIIVGTQMVAKGFDLPRLSVVGVINADAPLFLPDYRAGEEVFQQLTQIIGRNDRRGEGGRTLIQTAQPEHYAIRAALHHNYNSFYTHELTNRQQGGYPPFMYLLKITAQRQTVSGANNLLKKVQKELSSPQGLQILGPTPSFYEHAHGHKTWHLLLKSSSRTQLTQVARAYKTSDVICELDPQNLL